MDHKKIIALRMERQHIASKANEEEYVSLFCDLQPGQNVYWNGFGQPPTLSFRADFDDIEFNRMRQMRRELIKGRFAGGNLGWIVEGDVDLFAGLYRKPLDCPTEDQLRILELILNGGPFTIQQIKEETGLLVKQITPILHRLQEAFLIYEDQYDGEWDRGWYRFGEMFPDATLERYSRHEALKIVLRRFARRMVWFDTAMAKSFYRLPEKEIKLAVNALLETGVFTGCDGGYVLTEDISAIENACADGMHFVYAIHRNDVLYKSQEHLLKDWIKPLTDRLDYDHDPLQYLLIDGEFHGAVVGHFRNGPYDLNDVVCDLPDAESRRDEIIDAVKEVNFGKSPLRFMSKPIQ
ncbi:MAG: hypothetical protein E7337_09245 [Clostridiales bacterium]|nr:hypothetical protein [Clostridiales bacterium]